MVAVERALALTLHGHPHTGQTPHPPFPTPEDIAAAQLRARSRRVAVTRPAIRRKPAAAPALASPAVCSPAAGTSAAPGKLPGAASTSAEAASAAVEAGVVKPVDTEAGWAVVQSRRKGEAGFHPQHAASAHLASPLKGTKGPSAVEPASGNSSFALVLVELCLHR